MSYLLCFLLCMQKFRRNVLEVKFKQKCNIKMCVQHMDKDKISLGISRKGKIRDIMIRTHSTHGHCSCQRGGFEEEGSKRTIESTYRTRKTMHWLSSQMNHSHFLRFATQDMHACLPGILFCCFGICLSGYVRLRTTRTVNTHAAQSTLIACSAWQYST